MSDTTLPRKSSFHRSFAMGLLLATAAIVATTSSPTAQADRPVPFKAGEALVYDVSWSTFLTAGQATLSVKERRATGGGARYYLVAEAQPSSMVQKLYHLYYKAESMMDTRTLQPAMATVYSDENGRKRHKTSLFRSNGMVDYEVRTATAVKSTVKVGAMAQDPLGAIYVLRAIPLKMGMAAFNIPVTDSGKAYTMRVSVVAREQVRTGLGTIPGLKLNIAVTGAGGKSTDAPLTLWISDDARRLPLKFVAGLSVGSVQLTLAKAAG